MDPDEGQEFFITRTRGNIILLKQDTDTWGIFWIVLQVMKNPDGYETLENLKNQAWTRLGNATNDSFSFVKSIFFFYLIYC